MINIIANMAERRIEFSGHAGYAEPGKDIVCAAVSILKLVLDDTFSPIHGYSSDCDGGKVVIKCEPDTPWDKRNSHICMKIVLRGLMYLQRDYPENVSVKIE